MLNYKKTKIMFELATQRCNYKHATKKKHLKKRKKFLFSSSSLIKPLITIESGRRKERGEREEERSKKLIYVSKCLYLSVSTIHLYQNQVIIH